jgi:hypothetical protein
MIKSTDCEFSNRKQFPPGMHLPFCPSLSLTPPLHASPTMHSVRCLPQPVLNPSVVLSYFLSDCVEMYCPCYSHEWKPNCRGAISNRKHTSYNLAVKLDVIHHKRRGRHTIDIACALPIPETMIHTTRILYSAQDIETRALNFLKHSKVKITCQKSEVTVVMKGQHELYQ